MAERPERCDRCRWWDWAEDEGDDATGFCRRYAPRPLMVFQDTEGLLKFPLWPATMADEFCGEFTPAPLPPPPPPA